MDSIRLMELAARVEAWSGVHLYTRVVDDRQEPATDWYYVSIPARYLEEDDSSLLTILLHEWGHRTICPRTPRQFLHMQGLIVSEGLGDAADLVNIIADIRVDREYLRPHSEWEEVYQQGTLRHLDLMAEHLSAALSSDASESLAAQRLALVYDLECLVLTAAIGETHDPILPATEHIWSILSDNAVSDDEQTLAVARELRYLYPTRPQHQRAEPRTPAGLRGGSLATSPAANDIGPLLRGWRDAGIAIDESDMVQMLGREHGAAAFEEQQVGDLYAELAAPGRPSPTGALRPASPAGPDIWRWGPVSYTHLTLPTN